MLTTTAKKKTAAPRMALRHSIARYAAGEFSRRDIEKVFASTLDHDPNAGEVIREYLDQQLHERAISKSLHKDLLEQLSTHLPEDVPTESAEDAFEAAAASLAQPASANQVSSVAPSMEQKPAAQKAASQKPASIALTNPARLRQGTGDKPPVSVVVAKSTCNAQLGPGTILRERFRLDEAVASGSMGLVFRATDLLKLEAGAISPTIAIKVINPEFANDAAALRSFQNEVANTQHLSHPNIIRLFELDKDQGHYFITMEWLEGESLDALLDRSQGSALPPVQAYAIIEQLCDALDYAHSKQVIHADVKPGNVFLTKPGELKLIDFGIARILGPGDESGAKREKSVALTPAYASCECLEYQTATPQDDLFSLACLIYRLLSGRRVFGARTALQAEAEGSQPIAIGGMSARRWQALRKALAFRRADRQPDVRTFADEFGQRSEARSKIEPEPDDVPYTDTSNIDFNIDDFQEDLNDTGFLNVLEESEFPDQSLDDDNYLDDLNAEIEQQDNARFSSANPSAQTAACSDMDRQAAPGGASQAEFLLHAESTVIPETRLPTESTVPTERVGTGTIEIEILQEPALIPVDGSSQPAVSASSKEQKSGSLSSAANPGSAGAGKKPTAPVGSANYSPAVRPAAPKPVTRARNPVVQKLVAPTPAPATAATIVPVPVLERLITQPRYLAGGVCVLLALGAVMLGRLMIGPGSDAMTVRPLSADGIVVAVEAIETLSNRASEVAPQVLLAPGTQGSVTLGDSGTVDSVSDPATAGSGSTQSVPVTAATGIAAPATSVSESLGNSSDSSPTSGSANPATVDPSAAAKSAVAQGDFNPNGPVPFSALQLERYVEPEFPAAYAGKGLEGWVDVKLAIAADGSIQSVEIIATDLPPDFLPPSLAAARQWRFKPFVWNGIDIAASTTVRLTYSN